MSFQKILKNSSGVPTGEYADIGSINYADNPIGAILPYGGTTAPSGWMICNGASLLRASYPELFAVIGTSFGSADSTHFNIPDLRGEFLRGAGTNSHTNQGNGGTVGEHQDSTEILGYYQNNTNGMQVFGNNENNIRKSDNMISSATSHSATYNGNSNSQGGGSYTIRPTNTSVNYIIKAKMVGVPSDFLAKVDEVIDENAKSPISASNKLVTESELNTIGKVQVRTISLAGSQTRTITFPIESDGSYTYSVQEYSDTDGYHSFARTVRNMNSTDFDSLGVVKLQWTKSNTTATVSVQNTGANNATLTVFVTKIG